VGHIFPIVCIFSFAPGIVYNVLARFFMKRFLFICLCCFSVIPGGLHAQVSENASSRSADDTGVVSPIGPALSSPKAAPSAVLTTAVTLPRMAPEFALQVLQGHAQLQSAELAGYSATTVVRAQLPDTAQSGEYELKRSYSAPRTLVFKALRFTGDNFVKSNIILRVLHSEVDHVQKDDPALTAINAANYKFSYKGTSQLNQRVVHVYQIKPREKRAGLFKGKIYVDAYTGTLARAEGKLVRSPSLFVKRLEFVQDYADIDSFTFPVHIHSEAQARVVGRTVVDIYEQDYQPVSVNATQASAVVPRH
jgi:hypothetical protein